MKKHILPFYFLFFISYPSFSQGIWTWMSGDSSTESAAVFGMQGVPSVNNHPPAMLTPLSWTDLQGNFWLYGGVDVSYADLWMFNPSTLEWTWVNGTGAQNVPPVFGTIGVAAPGNSPGSRYASNCTWVDTGGNLWLFGGAGSSAGYGNVYSDVWRYNIASNEWTWMSGQTLPERFPNYGREGVAFPSNQPGSRQNMGSPWVDVNGKVWVYGGLNFHLTSNSDMWMYNPITYNWTWESGADTTDAIPVYGSKENFSPSNTPGARWPYSMITENNGNFLLFGGASFGSTYADMWEYNPVISQWAWLNGTKSSEANAVAGAVCQSDSAFYPDARYENAAWKDCAGNLWLFGGYNSTNAKTYGDVWVYLTASKKWARMTSSGNINMAPVYGTEGTPSLSNQPGARYGTAQWKDKDGNLWVFGGADHNSNIYGDMWRYTPDYSCLKIDCSCQPFAGTVSITQDSICEGTNLNSVLTVKGGLGHLQWQSSTDGIHFTALGNDTLNTYFPPPSLNQNTYYSVVATDSCGAATSNTVALRFLPEPAAAFTFSVNGKQVSFTSDSSTFYALAYHWSFGDDSTSAFANPVHTFDSIKDYNVCLTEYNATNCSNIHCTTVSPISGVNNINGNYSIQLYPNPADNNIHLSVNGLRGNYQLKIYNVLGVELRTDELSLHNNQNISFDLTNFAPGTYELVLMNDKEYYSERFMRGK